MSSRNSFDESFEFITNNLKKKSGCSFIECILEPIVLALGVIFNLIFMVLIYRNKYTSTLKTHKPFRFVLITLVACDAWFLINHANFWYFSLVNKPDLTTINVVCQFHSYFNNFFTVVQEIQMLLASYLLVDFISSHTVTSSEIYNKFLTEEDIKRPSTMQKIFNMIVKFISSQSKSNKQPTLESSPLKDFNDIQPTTSKNEQMIDKKSTAFTSSTPSTNNECSLKSTKFNKSGFKVMLKILDHIKRKNESIYTDIIIKEKFITLLSILICMYMLSFFLWIKIINYDANQTTSIILKNICSSKNKTITKNCLNSELLQNLNKTTRKACIIHASYKPFYNYYQAIQSFLRSLTLLINIFVSIKFFIKFRYQYLRSIYVRFRNPNMSRLNIIKFKSVYILYPKLNDQHKLVSDYDFKKLKKYSNLNNEVSNEQESHEMFGFHKRNAKERREALMIQSHYNHFHFVRHYVLTIFIYSLLVSSSVMENAYQNFNELLRKETSYDVSHSPSINSLSKSINITKFDFRLTNYSIKTSSHSILFNNGKASFTGLDSIVKSNHELNEFKFNKSSPKTNAYSDLMKQINDNLGISTNQFLAEFIHLTEVLSHSTKFVIYILFSIHFSFYFKYEKKAPRSEGSSCT